MDFEFAKGGAPSGGEVEVAAPAAGGLHDLEGGSLLGGGFEGEFVGSALEWDDRELLNLLRCDTLAATPPAAAGALCADGDAAAVQTETAALRDAASDQAASARRAVRAVWQRGHRERLKAAKSQRVAELEAAEKAVAALRAENAALEERVAALSLVSEYTEEMAAVVEAAAEQEHAHARQAPAGPPKGRLALLAGTVFRALPPSACKLLMTKNGASVAQVRFFAEHATVEQFYAAAQIRAAWVKELAQQCVDGDQEAESLLTGMLEVQNIMVRTAAHLRIDVLEKMATTTQPAATRPHSLGAAAPGVVAGVNPRLLPLRHQAALTPCQRAQLEPHWRSFCSESRVLRQEMRATMARVCASPEALIATYQVAQTSAETLLSATEAAAALRELYHSQLRMSARLVLALFTLLSTKQAAFVFLATQPHTPDPEQICQVLLGDDDEGLPGGGDRGHVLAELDTSGASSMASWQAATEAGVAARSRTRN